MTAGTNGNGNATPEDDDPFAYLYRQEGGQNPAEGGTTVLPQGPYGGPYGDQGQTHPYGTQPYSQPGVPRTSYNAVTRVGQTTYGQRGGYGYPPQQQPTAQYAQPQGHPQQQYAQQQYAQQQYGQQQYAQQRQQTHAQPEPDGYGPRGGGPGGRRGGGGPRGNRGLLIGAVAVVAAVAVGIGIVVALGDNDDGKPGAKPNPGASTPSGGRPRSTPVAKPRSNLPPVTDAASLPLLGGAQTSTEHPGAFGQGGQYVDHMNAPGATVTWKVTVPDAGQYRFNVRYANAGGDAKATLVVNDKPQSINLGNFSGQNDWGKAWTRSFGLVTLIKGENTIAVTCGPADQCGFNLDQFALTKSGYPKKWP
jgi:Carbohydrate binding module (family 35)